MELEITVGAKVTVRLSITQIRAFLDLLPAFDIINRLNC
jgi:hypothetical protein